MAPYPFLPADTRPGPVRLQVSDLGRSLVWYPRILGPTVLEQGPGRVLLGAADGTPLVELRLGTEPVDLPALVRAGGEAPRVGLPAGTVMGHLHLHVGDLGAAQAFYARALGLGYGSLGRCPPPCPGLIGSSPTT